MCISLTLHIKFWVNSFKLYSNSLVPRNGENQQCWFSSVQLLSCALLFVTPWTAAHQASLSMTNSWSFPRLMSIESTISSSSSPSPSAFNLSQQQGLFFASGGQNIRASASASVLPMSLTMLVINSKEYFHYHVAMASKHLFHTRSYYNNRWQVLLLLLLFSYQW